MRRSGLRVMVQLIGLIRPLIHVMAAAVILGIAGYLCAIFIPVLGGLGVLRAMGTGTSLSMGTITASIIFCAVLRGVLRYTEQASNHYIAFKLLALIRHQVFRALQKLAPAKLEGRETGNLIAIITSDIELLEVFYAHTISPVMIGFFTSLIMVVFLWTYHPLIGIITGIGYSIVGVVIPLWISACGKEDGMNYRNGFGELNTYFLDNLRGLKECIQYDAGEERMHEMLEKTDQLDGIQKNLKEGEGKTKAVSGAIIVMTGLAVLFVSVYLMSKEQLGFEGILIGTIAALSSFGPVLALSSLSNNLVYTLASGERVLALLEEAPVTKVVEGKASVRGTEIECEKVKFAYGEEVILNNCSLKLDKNKIIGIHGKSGSGKSTLLKLLMRFWDINDGKISVSGQDMKEVNTKDLRNMEAYMTQETYLFHNTIRENISISKPDASMEEIIDAARKASVHDYISSLPDKYNTQVAEMGESLSGGERQRIGLARAFLHDAPVLLLDEPTSNLDSLNEGIILKSLKEYCREKTIVLVSHRRSTMNIADKIYRMETGRVS